MKKTLIIFVMLMCALTISAQEKFLSHGQERTMVVYAPKNLPKNRPLLISMHGYNQSATYQRDQARYDLVADTAKFVVVYPDGLGEPKGWDTSGTRDINFITDIIDEMYNRYGIDKRRVYLSGFSMGGMMTYHAMTQIADKIAAFAPVSGYRMAGPLATSSRPIPILHVHGTSDDVCSYSPVQSHIDAWVSRNQCNSTAFVQRPQSAVTSSEARIKRYRNGLNGVEVALLTLPGKGHWHSNDVNCAMTNIEIWNFCNRYSLPPAPEMVKVTPEPNSFDMSNKTDKKFVVEFDMEVDCSKVTGFLNVGGKNYKLTLAEKTSSKTLTFTSSLSWGNGDAKLKISNISATGGGVGNDVVINYTYGVEEVGDEPKTATVWSQDWYSQKSAIGEGCPLGWTRVNSRSSDGAKSESTSGSANTGGARMKYFDAEKDFNAGFYISAREYEICKFTYGNVTGYPLTLEPGHYVIKVPSIYWNDGAMSSANTFSLKLTNKSTGATIVSAPTLTPSGCMYEKEATKITNSALDEVEFTISAKTSCVLEFSMSAGWNGIIIGEPLICQSPSTADIYKGGFLRMLKTAKNTLEMIETTGKGAGTAQAKALEEAIKEYEDFVSISPSEYEAATKSLRDAYEAAATGVKTVAAEGENEYYRDLYGNKFKKPLHPGIYIKGNKKIAWK